MDVHRAAGNRIQHRTGQDPAVGHHYQDIGPGSFDLLEEGRPAGGPGLIDRKTEGAGQRLHRGGLEPAGTAGRPIRVGDHQGDTVTRVVDRLQERNRHFRRSEEGYIHNASMATQSPALILFLIFLFTISRFREEMFRRKT